MPNPSLDALEQELLLAAVLRMLLHVNRLSAHDARAPMNTIQLSLELLAGLLADELPEAAPRWQRHVSVIRDEIGRLNRVLDAALEHRDPTEARPEALDLRELLGEVVRALGYEARKRKVDLRVVGDGPLSVRAPRVALKAALFHLLSQVFEQCPEQGHVLIESNVDAPWVTVTVQTDRPVALPGAGDPAVDPLLRITHRILEMAGGSARSTGTGLAIRLPAGTSVAPT